MLDNNLSQSEKNRLCFANYRVSILLMLDNNLSPVTVPKSYYDKAFQEYLRI